MILVIVLLIAFAIVTAMGATYGARLALIRRNQVVRGIRSPAPIGWLTSSRREAKIHRRLRALGHRLELVGPADGTADLIAGLRSELVRLDAHLVTVVRRPTAARRVDRRELADRVTEVEELVRRVEERSRLDAVPLHELTERLDALEAADDELRGLGPGSA